MPFRAWYFQPGAQALENIMRSSPIETSVLIVGAGPVGLTLAADLAWRGVDCVIVDPRTAINPHPRAISIGVRSM